MEQVIIVDKRHKPTEWGGCDDEQITNQRNAGSCDDEQIT